MKKNLKPKKMRETTLYVLILSTDYGNERTLGIYSSLAYANKAKEIVIEGEEVTEYGAELWVKQVKLNQAPTEDFLLGYFTKEL